MNMEIDDELNDELEVEYHFANMKGGIRGKESATWECDLDRVAVCTARMLGIVPSFRVLRRKNVAHPTGLGELIPTGRANLQISSNGAAVSRRLWLLGELR